jgi:hypothetical protein
MLQYLANSKPNTIDVLTQDGLLLGVITGQNFFVRTAVQFQQATNLSNEDMDEISYVIQSIQQVV